MLRVLLIVFSVLLFLQNCSVKYSDTELKSTNESEIKELTSKLTYMSKTVDKSEAATLAKEAVIYSKELANKYKLVAPASFHNFLVNVGLRDRGLCHQFATDLGARLGSFGFKSFDIVWIVANKQEYFEHNALAIKAKDVSLQDSIILDPWRNSSKLYFEVIKNDKDYRWIEDVQYSISKDSNTKG